jgi:PAS domain S-box-containing protein
MRNFTNTNQAGLDLLGYSREELLHLSVADVDADPAAALPAEWGVPAGGRLINYEHRLRRKDGAIITVLNSSTSLADVHGNVAGILSTLIDITERKRAEEALRLSEERFAKAFHQSPDAILITRAGDGRVAEVNEGFTRLSGFARDEALGSFTIALDLWAKAGDRERCVAALQSGGSVSGMEFAFRTRSGAVLQCLYAGALIDVEGEPHVLSVVRDMSERRQAEEALARSADELREQVRDTVKTMGAIIGLRDPYTAAHERRVTELAVAIAVEMGLGEEEREGLALAAEVHDIGKIGIPAEILSKPAALTEEEFALIKRHPQAGRELLGAIHFLQPVAEIVAQHQERTDGSGYPRGLRGEEILLEARILAVADVVEAMASHRPYRPSLGLAAALAEVRGGAGGRYDATVVAACERVFAQGFVFTEP